MSEAKHTPGPWSVDDGEWGYVVHSSDTSDDVIASLQPADEPAESECLANARLVAAAPDLLDAVRWACKELVKTERQACMRPTDCVDCPISRAIKKAEGV
jgi:predicted Zn-ribbon and HTH transcriptional regulator